jgi:hypothetical protein
MGGGEFAAGEASSGAMLRGRGLHVMFDLGQGLPRRAPGTLTTPPRDRAQLHNSPRD